MLCPRCRRENRDSSEFCAACGAPLKLREEPAPRSLDVTVPLDRRGRERAAPPPPPARPAASRAAPPTTEWLAPPAPDDAERSHWDLRPVAAAARPEPALAPPPPRAASETWAGPPPASAAPRPPTETWLGPAAETPAPVAVPAPAAVPELFPFGPRQEATAALVAELDLADAVDVPARQVRLRRAPSWRRVLSWVIDLAPFVALTVWLAGQVLAPAERAGLGQLDGVIDVVARHAGIVIPFLAFLALAGATYLALAYALMGASVGKWLTGLRVVSKDGRRPSPRRSAVRAVLAVVSVALAGLGVILALFTRTGRALHDLLAGTYVVEKP